MFLSLHIFFLITVAVPATFAIKPPTGTLTCDGTSFSPTMQMSGDPVGDVNDNVKIRATLGTGGEGCKVDEIELGLSDTITWNRQSFSGSDVPYQYGTKADPVCGGTMNTTYDSYIKYEVPLDVHVTEVQNGLKVFKFRYRFNLKCELKRNPIKTAPQTYTVKSEVTLEEDPKSESGTFQLQTSLDFYQDDTYAAVQPNTFTINNNAILYLAVTEGIAANERNSLFKFTVQRCFASISSDISDTTTTDELITGECPVDSSIQFTRDGGDDMHTYKFQLRAFYMLDLPTTAVYIHCELYVCQAAADAASAGGKCVQSTETQCNNQRRRRRRNTIAVEGKAEGKAETVVASQYVIIDRYELINPYCPVNTVHNKISKKCTGKQILEVKGIHLDLEWNKGYANSSSPVFLKFAMNTEYLLYALVQNTFNTHLIKGIKIIRASKGGIVLDVLITYSEDVSAEEAFAVFQEILYKTTSKITRVVKLLKIRSDKIIEFFPIDAQEYDDGAGKKMDSKTILIIVIVVALLVVIGMSLIVFCKRSRRSQKQSPPMPPTPNGYNNNAVEGN